MKIYVLLIVIILPIMAFVGVIFDINPLSNFIHICRISVPNETECYLFLIRTFAFLFLLVAIVRVMSIYMIAALNVHSTLYSTKYLE